MNPKDLRKGSRAIRGLVISFSIKFQGSKYPSNHLFDSSDGNLFR